MSLTPPVMPFMTADASLVQGRSCRQAGRKTFAPVFVSDKETAETRSSFRKGFFSVEFFSSREDACGVVQF